MMADNKLAIVFDGPPSHESGRFVEVELNGASVSFGEWQENGEYWELVLPGPYTRLATLEAELKAAYRFVEMAGSADSSGGEYRSICQECAPGIMHDHTGDCALNAWLGRNFAIREEN